jgi:hypothetical protein
MEFPVSRRGVSAHPSVLEMYVSTDDDPKGSKTENYLISFDKLKLILENWN